MLKRLLLILIFASIPVLAKDSTNTNYRTIYVANRLHISVPQHWPILPEITRRDISAAAEAMITEVTEIEQTHVSSLSVHAPPEPTGAIIRVSFIDSGGLSQAELIRAMKSDPAATMKELRAEFKTEIALLSQVMLRNGISILGPPKTTLEAINGKLAIVVGYRRTGSAHGTTFNVTQYHIPLGSDTALVTLSYREQDAILYGPILKRVKASISVI